MTDVLARLDQARGECNVLEHPFYERWSAGELSARGARVLRGRVSPRGRSRWRRPRRRRPRRPARRTRAGCARTPRRRRRTWSCGTTSPAPRERRDAADANDASASRRRHVRGRGRRARACSSTWRCSTRSRPASRRSRQTKLEGLTEHYGYSEEGPALEYFKLHELLDVEHARAGGRADRGAARRLATSPRRRPSGCSRGHVRRCVGNWDLLSGVEAAAA